ncbi:LPXTG cell wall anchor domain-containing protein [Levilactobacillus mulengensis]|uniref:LPXTG cell wall anchor domain-containing protein n=1 Tax=Levilactobacillus mulengensis TaxID=2486025 RepID=UPI0013DE62BC|nr:LPXTG cell wall anchor domain-containing protein [Levilactobacillus mulengensis]
MRDYERKTHYKMYKSHRGWLVAGITVTSMAVGIVAGPQASQTAQAADNTPTTTATISGQSATSGAQAKLSAATTTDKSTGNDNGDKTPTPVAPQKPVVGSAPVQPATDKSTGSDNGDKTPTPVAPQKPVVESAPVQPADGGTPANDGIVAPKEPSSNQTTPAPGEKPTARTAVTTAAPFKTGISVQDTDDLTNKVAATPAFNISKTDQLQYTYNHVDSAGHNTDLRVVDGYDASHQVQGAGTWLGETYANQIAQDAKGIDPVTSAKYGTQLMYIDEWLPDYGLQYFLWQNNYAKTYATIADFRNNFSKAELATLTSIYSNDNLQAAAGNQPTTYYQSIMAMQTLEGLQNAVNLQVLDISPNLLVSLEAYGTGEKNSNLWDIRALSGLKNLREVQLPTASINDISALGNHDKLTDVSLFDNQITDISPLATDKNLLISKASLFQQHVLLAPIKVSNKLAKGANSTDAGMLTYTTPSFIIKDLTASNLPIQGFDNASDLLYPSLYPSSSDAGNLNSNTLTWYNLLNSTDSTYGSLSTTWSDTNSNFAGYIIQPYELAANVSDLNVNIQLLQANDQQLNLAPATLISGDIGSSVDVQQNATVQTLLNQQLSKGYTFSGLILDGTGLYSDYAAKNGKANAQTSWATTLGDESKNWTILFYKGVMPWTVSVGYGVKDANGNYTPITNADGTAVTANYKGTSADKLALTDYERDFDDYVYTGAETSADGQTWTDISQAADIPYVNDIQAVRMVYAQAKKATVTIKDATTGKTLQVLDATTNPELKGAIGSTSSFDSNTVIAPELAKGYTVVSDTTKNADGTSAIVFAKDATANLDYTITLAHAFKTVEQAVHEQITYQDKQQKTVAAPVTKTVNFATVTDQVTQDAVTYSKLDATATPELDVTGKPTDASWVVYQAGSDLAFAAVKNPSVPGMHVVSTTDPANVLTQTVAQPVTPTTGDLSFVVTYDANPTSGGGDNGNNGGGTVTPPVTPTTPTPGDNGGAAAAVVTPKKPTKPTKPTKPNQGGQAVVVNKKTIRGAGHQAGGTVTAGGQGAKVQALTAPVEKTASVAKTATATTDLKAAQLPQTNEQQLNGLAVIGLALLGALTSVVGWKKRRF